MQPGLALLRLAQGNAYAAQLIITRALDEITWDRLARSRLLPARAQIAIAVGDLDAAADAADELDAIAPDYESSALTAAAMTTRGRLLLASNDRGACAMLRQAADCWHELRVPHEVATARVLYGAACQQVGDLDSAAAAFEAARLLFEQLGAERDLRDLLGISDPTPAFPCGLSPREVEVLRHVASGSTNKQVALELYLSEKTVARHLSNIFTKINVSSRSGATAFAFAHQLVP